jgi:hypothetical protein
VFLYVFFFGKRRVVARPVPAGPQEVTVVVSGGYKPDVIAARKGMPLKLIFDRRESNPCSDEIVIPEFGIRTALPAHQKTTIEITPSGGAVTRVAPGNHSAQEIRSSRRLPLWSPPFALRRSSAPSRARALAPGLPARLSG